MNYATIGTSMITERFIEAAAESGRLTLKAIYSRDLEKATRFANQYEVKLVFNHLEKLANCDEIEVVYIASPNSIHYEQAIFLMEHGKHIICEKPMFTSMKEWEKAFETARKNHVFLFEAMRTIHAPNFKLLKDNLGRVGQIRNVNLQYMKYSSRYDQYLDGEVPNIFSAKFAGGALVDLGIYPLYMAIALFGKPESSVYVPVMLESGVDGGGTLVLQYNDFVCTIVCSKITDSYGSNEIHGEKGNIIFPGSGTVGKIEYIDRKSKVCEPFSIEQTDNDMVYEIETFTNIIKTGDEERYLELTHLSGLVLNVMEEVRKKNGIIFGPDN
ncbi:Gfo/Idh/MocA family protein [Pradoshia sp.]